MRGTGIWDSAFRFADTEAATEAARTAERLGYDTVWLPDLGGDDLFHRIAHLLAATERITVATGVLNLWMHEPALTADRHAELNAEFGGRFLLGLGVGNAQDVGERFRQPLAAVRSYLDALDAAETPVPESARVLGAVGPAMLALARDRTAGAHPYLVTAEHVHTTRSLLGPGKLLAPELCVVLDTDPTTARATARAFLAFYLDRGLPIIRNVLRHGFTEDDLSGHGSDRLVDELVAWGDERTIAARVREYRDAGADHVAIQVLTDDTDRGTGFPLVQWERLAATLVD